MAHNNSIKMNNVRGL